MFNPSERISPSEINKYVYCPYGWYYERLYGRKRLNGLRKTYLQTLGIDDPGKDAYVKGQKFHKQYRSFSFIRAVMQTAAFIIIVYVFVYFFFK